MMRNMFIAIFMAVVCGFPVMAQRLANYTENFTQSGAGSNRAQYGSGIQYHKLTWYVKGTLSSCTVKLEKSDDGVTWSDLIADQTCTSNGVSTLTSGVAGFIRINVTTFVGSGSPTLIVNYGGYIDRVANVSIDGIVIEPLTGNGTSGPYSLSAKPEKVLLCSLRGNSLKEGDARGFSMSGSSLSTGNLVRVPESTHPFFVVFVK